MNRFLIQDGDEAVFVINGKEITVSKKTITPQMADEIISYSDSVFSNRKSRRASYDLYADEMKKGKWRSDNGETIKFGADNALVDGRNRLNAVMLSEKAVDFLCVGNVERDAVETIDIGIKRSLENMLQMQEHAYETGAAQIVREKLQLDKKIMAQGQSNAQLGLSMLEQIEEYEKNAERYNSISRYSKDIRSTSHRALNCPEIGGIYLHLTETLKWDRDVVDEFFDKLATPTKRTIFFTTYENLMNKKVCRGKDRIKEYIICWNSYIGGKRVLRDSYKDGDWFTAPKASK